MLFIAAILAVFAAFGLALSYANYTTREIAAPGARPLH